MCWLCFLYYQLKARASRLIGILADIEKFCDSIYRYLVSMIGLLLLIASRYAAPLTSGGEVMQLRAGKVGIGICQDSFAVSRGGVIESFKALSVGSKEWWHTATEIREIFGVRPVSTVSSIEAVVVVSNRFARFAVVKRPADLSVEQQHETVRAALTKRYGGLRGWAYAFAPFGRRGLISWAVPMDWLWLIYQALHGGGVSVSDVVPAFWAGFWHSKFNLEHDGVFAMYESGHLVSVSCSEERCEERVFSTLPWAQLQEVLHMEGLDGGDGLPVHLIAPACTYDLSTSPVDTWFVNSGEGGAGIYAEWAASIKNR